MPPKGNARGKGKSKAYQLASIDAQGLTVKDLYKKEWKIGKPVGSGGFGRLYQVTDVSNGTGSNYVIKIEPHDNGPLFSELSFYQRKAKKEKVEEYMGAQRLKKLGMPLYISSGQHEHDGCKYRFMVIPQYKTDLQKLFLDCNKKFPLKIVLTVALQVLEVLEYLHTNDYVHADIKAANLLLGLKDSHQVYLVDFGLARIYSNNGVHQPYKEDPRKAHDGTIEFTSRDAHKGCAPSRRGDLEILGYCCIQWLVSQLPWETCLSLPEGVRANKVFAMKNEFMTTTSLKKLASQGVPQCLIDYMMYVMELDYDEEPDYGQLKSYLKNGMKKEKITHDGKLDFSSALRSCPSTKRKSLGKRKEPTPKKSRASSSKPSTSYAKAKGSAAGRAVASEVKPVALDDLISDSDESSTSNILNKNNSSRRKSVDPRALKAIKKAKSTVAAKNVKKTKVNEKKPLKPAAPAVLHSISPGTAATMRKAKALKRDSTEKGRSPRLHSLQTVTTATQTSPNLAGLKGRRRPK
ncbi:serine/threonine-protein kinase VRK1-like isoform X2 [Watersipora subatra]|uniref:serine/threonine-protein kinase VRK1-like isoform X2 n=1 Tax=Watersipora subatra TaxID=2589382 RepID=UPI00355B6EA4